MIRHCARLALTVLVCILVGALLLTAVYCIPGSAFRENLDASAWVLLDEGLYPWLFPWCTSMVDNFTDTYMLQHAAYRNDRSPLVQAMEVYRPMFETAEMPYQDLQDHYLEGKAYTAEGTYGRYWHGYLVYLAPLLLVLDYGQIRVFNGLCQAGLFLALCILLYKRKRPGYIAPLAVMLCFLNPVVQAVCLQYSSCHYLLLFGCIALAAAGEKLESRESYIFLLLGVATAYFDYLTYPIATLGVPLCLYYGLKTHRSFWEDLRKGICLCFTWVFGYGGMWAGKWVLATLVTGENKLLGGLAKVSERTTGDEVTVYGEVVEHPISKAFTENETFFWATPAADLLNLLMAVLVVLLLVQLLRRKVSFQDLIQAAPFLVIAAMPYLWYAVTANHSIIHAWFTHKSLCLTALALPCMVIKVLEKRQT